MSISGQQPINIGLPNESINSDSLYTAFTKTELNFNTLFTCASPFTNFVGGTGITTASNAETGTVTITNAGVTNIIAGTNIVINQSNGNVTISSTGGGGGGGSGTVTSVGITPVSTSRLAVTNSPIISSGNIGIDLVPTGVTAGAYTNPNVTVDAYGRVTTIQSGATPGTVTSVGLTAGPGVQVNGGPITTAGNIVVTNTGVLRLSAGNGIDLSASNGNITVSLSGSGTGTVTSVGIYSTSLDVTNSPITTSGQIRVELPANPTISGNLTTGNASLGTLATASYFSGDGSNLTNLNGSNVVGTVGSATTSGTVTTAAQPNITSVGTLTALAVVASANPSLGNTVTANFFSGSGQNLSNIQASNVSGTVANASNATRVSTTLVATGTYFLPFISATTTANYSLNSNGAFSANLANGALIATTFVGNLTGNVTGNISGNIVAAGANTQVLFNDAGNVNATSGMTFNKSTNLLTVTGNIVGGNLTTAGALNVSGNVSFSGANVSLGAVGNLKITGGVANALLQTDGTGNLVWTTPTTSYVHTQSSAATTWVVTHNLGVRYVNVQVIDSTGNSFTGRYNYPTITFNNTSALTVTFDSAQAGFAAVTSGGGSQGPQGLPGSAGSGSISNGVSNVAITTSGGNVTVGVGGNANVLTVTQTGANVIGTLTATANISAVNGIFTNVSGNGSSLTSINGANVTGTVPSATTATSATSATSATTAGTVTANAQGNITSVGTLTSLAVTGNITAGNATLGNLVKANFFQGDGGLLTNIAVSAGTSIVNGTSNVVVDASGSIRTSASGNANIQVVTGTGVNVAGSLNATGNVTLGTFNVTGLTVNSTTYTEANVYVGNTNSTGVALTVRSNGPRIYFEKYGTPGNSVDFVGYNTGRLTYNSDFWNEAANSGHSWFVDGSEKMRMDANGNLGIANLAPTHTLSVTGTLNVSGNANVGNIGANNAVFTSVSGNGAGLSSITGANVSGTVSSATTAGTVTTAAQPNITSVSSSGGTFTIGNTSNGGAYFDGAQSLILNTRTGSTEGAQIVMAWTGVSGLTGQANSTWNIDVNGSNNYRLFYQNASGTIGIPLTAFSANADLATGANISVAGYVIRSIGTSIAATGSTQGTATALTKEINVVSSVSVGSGVVLPTAVAGMVLIVNNTSANTLNVYPASGGVINSGSTNAAYSHVAGASLQYYATSTTQWYTVGASYA